MSVTDRFRLDGKVAIVTGASSGLGVEFALALAAAGADVALGARRADRLDEVAGKITAMGRRAIAVTTDVTDAEDCERLVAETVTGLGRVDVLVNNAGVGGAALALRQSVADYQGLLEVNLVSAYAMARAFCSAVAAAGHGGSIVNVGSVLGSSGGFSPQAGYASAKAGLIGLTRDLAGQWSQRYGIRVNLLVPAFFPTDLTTQVVEDEQWNTRARAHTLMGRLGETDELIGPLLLLASDAGSYMTGSTVSVDGGWGAF